MWQMNVCVCVCVCVRACVYVRVCVHVEDYIIESILFTKGLLN